MYVWAEYSDSNGGREESIVSIRVRFCEIGSEMYDVGVFASGARRSAVLPVTPPAASLLKRPAGCELPELILGSTFAVLRA